MYNRKRLCVDLSLAGSEAARAAVAPLCTTEEHQLHLQVLQLQLDLKLRVILKASFHLPVKESFSSSRFQATAAQYVQEKLQLRINMSYVNLRLSSLFTIEKLLCAPIY